MRNIEIASGATERVHDTTPALATLEQFVSEREDDAAIDSEKEIMNTWCDKLASTPAVGFKFQQTFIPAESILNILAPILNQELDGERPTFVIEKVEPFVVHFITDSGLRYKVEPGSLSITYNHRVIARDVLP